MKLYKKSHHELRKQPSIHCPLHERQDLALKRQIQNAARWLAGMARESSRAYQGCWPESMIRGTGGVCVTSSW